MSESDPDFRLRRDVADSYDEELEKFFYDENKKKNPREKHILLASVRNHISKIRKNNFLILMLIACVMIF